MLCAVVLCLLEAKVCSLIFNPFLFLCFDDQLSFSFGGLSFQRLGLFETIGDPLSLANYLILALKEFYDPVFSVVEDVLQLCNVVSS